MGDGVEPENITVLSFNTAKRDTLKAELSRDLATGDKIDVATMHAKVLSLCRTAGLVNLSQERIIMQNNVRDEECYVEFFDQVWDGQFVDYEHNINKESENFEKVPVGNRILDAGDYCKSMGWDFDKVHQTPHFAHIPLSWTTVSDLLDSWTSYKSERGYLEHTDYLQLCYEHELTLPNHVQMLVIDEMQDYNPLMYGIYKIWRDGDEDTEPPERILLGGDPAQSIYGFRAATPYYLQHTESDETEYLTTSRRCAPAIMNIASRLLAPLKEYPTEEYDSMPMRETEDGIKDVDTELKGVVQPVSLSSETKLGLLVERVIERNIKTDEDEVYVLARTNRDVKRISRILRDLGIPYGGIGDFDTEWDSDLAPVYHILRSFDKREPVPRTIVPFLLRNATLAESRSTAVKLSQDHRLSAELSKSDPWGEYPDSYLTADDKVRPEVISMWFDDVDSAAEILPKLDFNDHETKVLHAALLRDSEILVDDELSIRIGTIHASKGDGVNAVILLTDYSKKQLERYKNGNEPEERRLYYVGCTRARDELYLLQNVFENREVFPPIRAL